MSKTATKPATLTELLDAMRLDHPSVMCARDVGQWSADLPTFGGEEPACTLGCWSWDETHVLIGTCNDDLEMVTREYHAEEILQHHAEAMHEDREQHEAEIQTQRAEDLCGEDR